MFVVKHLQNVLSLFRDVTVDGVWIGFIDHIYAPLGTADNYSFVIDLHKCKSSPVWCVFNSHFLVTDVNCGDFSASHTRVLPSRTAC
jgi:hypothetical protein